MNTPPIELVLFDLGGVLADFRSAEALSPLMGGTSEDEIWARWLSSPWMRRFDAGLCSPQEFAQGAVTEWELPLSADDFLSAFDSWLVGAFDGAEELVQRTHARVQVGCLSNMNPVHWEGQIAAWAMTGLFDPRFVSFELGLVKPDDELFHHVTRAIDPDPSRVLFIDDNPVNVERAAANGFRSARARGVQEAERALLEYGVLPDPGASGPGKGVGAGSGPVATTS